MSQSVEVVAYDFLTSPLGDLTVFVGDAGVCGLHFGRDREDVAVRRARAGRFVQDAGACRSVVEQLEEYFYEGRRSFDCTVDARGTEFSEAVWMALTEIPYGEVRTYKQVAEAIGRSAAMRAVGQANRNNPTAIIVPCHRVVGASGAMVGYDGSHTNRKEWLLAHEGVTMRSSIGGDRRVVFAPAQTAPARTPLLTL